MRSNLRVPCSYQGGKQRIASQVVDLLLKAAPRSNPRFYDLCCGSGAISIELVNRGVDPSTIYMLDISSWGLFWSAIGAGTFSMEVFDQLLSELPENKREYKSYMLGLSKIPIEDTGIEVYPLLQACSFGGKQIWRNGNQWANTCFRDYWEPTETSIRRSPANPMQPGPSELRRRIQALVDGMKSVNCLNTDIMSILNSPIPDSSVVYVDPPYKSTTKYAFNFDLESFINRYREKNKAPLIVSEGVSLNERSMMLSFGGAKGGISGSKKGKHEEWLSCF